MPDESEGTAESLTTSHSLGDFFIGLGISLGAACLNAFGLNLTKLDHAKASVWFTLYCMAAGGP